MTSAGSTENRAKKPYERPELVVYGDIRELTQAIGTTAMSDGGHGAHTRTA